MTSDEKTCSWEEETSWQDAVCMLIDEHVARGDCFSSGELARTIRLARPDFRFAVTELGEFVKDLFHDGAIGTRTGPMFVQVPRRTTGRSRTPVGTEVFVYAPTPQLGAAHDFEVEIPRPAFTPTDGERKRFSDIAQSSLEMTAKVHGDGRLCIPRRAFEQLSHATGFSIRGGDQVWIGLRYSIGSPHLCIYLDSRNDCTPHALQPNRGRVRFSAPAGLPAFKPGDQFEVTVEGSHLRINL